MAFRPRKEETNNSIGYRLSSDRQPGIGIANNRMPQYSIDIERMPFPRPGGQGERFMPPNPTPVPMPMPMPDRGMPLPAPMPMPDREFDFRRNMPLPVPMPSPDREFDFRRNMPMPATPTAYVPGDDYGSFIPDSVLEMDRFGADYGPADEYEFDRDLYKHRIRTPYIDDIMPDYYYRGGIASLLR